MKLRNKIGLGVLIVFGLAVGSLAAVLGYTAECPAATSSPAATESMRAIVYRCYGPPEVLALETTDKPVPDADDVLVRVHAAAVNPLDWHYMRGSPYFMRLGSGIGAPQNHRLGVDFAGTVEAVGAGVTGFEVGDAVFGGRTGAFSEFVTVSQDRAIAHKPDNVSFEQAAGVPVAALTALQALRDKGNLKAGQSVLINGASGGVGTFAVQIAKAMGADVTGVCSTRNVELVRSLGADHVIDYRKEDYTDGDAKYDVIVDMVGNHSLFANRRVMTDSGRLVIVGAPQGDWIRPLLRPLGAVLLNPFVDQEFVMLLAELRQDDLVQLADWMAAGQVTPVIDQTFPLAGTADAIRYSETGRARGKIIIDVGQ